MVNNFFHMLDAERSLHQMQDALVQGDWNVSANLVSPYKPLGGGWETY
jgi:outer membrane protein TolC